MKEESNIVKQNDPMLSVGTGNDLPTEIKIISKRGRKKKIVDSDTTPKVRIPLHKQNDNDFSSFNLDKKKYHYLFANNNPKRIGSLLMANYNFALDNKGKRIGRNSGTGADSQILMFTDNETFKKDELDALKKPMEIAKDIGQGKVSRFIMPDSSNFYAPIGTSVKYNDKLEE